MGKKSWLKARSSLGTKTERSLAVLMTYRPSGETWESIPSVRTPSSRR